MKNWVAIKKFKEAIQKGTREVPLTPIGAKCQKLVTGGVQGKLERA